MIGEGVMLEIRTVRRCERSEAIQTSAPLDGFAPLATTILIPHSSR
jgi:hypothetical protein